MSARILAIDPGPEKSGWLTYDLDVGICYCGVDHNHEIKNIISDFPDYKVAIEMIASYGMAVGREVFDTCVWIGRFIETAHRCNDVELVFRRDVKLHLCGSVKAKDANIRQALIDRLGPQGTKKKPGPTYGVKSHAWAALAVAVYVADTMGAE